jgi:hypothetical protein
MVDLHQRLAAKGGAHDNERERIGPKSTPQTKKSTTSSTISTASPPKNAPL